MSEMVERVARALIVRYAEQHGGFTDRSQDEFEADARAAIAAMREPDKAMSIASNRGESVLECWQLMIDEALK